MKTISTSIQWLVVLAIAGFAAYPFLKGRPQPDRQPETWRSWQGFMALSYAGVGPGDPDVYPTPARLAEQLEALHAAGYRTITPADALAFLQGQAPLPRKALLLLFEGGRKDSVIHTAKPFRKTGFCGTLCLPTRALDSRGAFFLRRTDLRRVAKMNFWLFAGMGHEAIDEIPVGPGGAQGHFLTRRKWTPDGAESPDAFRQRIAADYAACADAIEKETGARPLAYVYPFADAGQGPESDPDALALNREQVEKHFRMAFVNARQPFNGPGRDPFDLSRLRVPGNLSGAELVWLLEQHAPRSGEAGDLRNVDAWQIDGNARFNETGVEFDPDGPAWARGSDLWSDVEVQATVRITSHTVASIYARYASPKSFLRVTLSPAGIRLQENQGGRMRTLHWQPDPLADGVPVDVRLRVKGSRVWLWRGDEKLAGPLPLAEPRRQGRVGVGSEAGPFQIDAFHATPLETVYAVASGLDGFSPEDFAHAKALIFPLDWPADGTAPKLPRAIVGPAAQGTEVIPRLPNGPSAPDALAGLEALLGEPVARGLISRVAIPSPSASVLQRLHDANLAVIAIVPAADLLQGGFEVAALRPDDMLLLEGPAEESLRALDKLLAIYPAYRTLAFLDSAQSAELGIAQAVRHEP